MPTVSVIIPTYNRAEILPRAIESVLAQTHEDFELIIVDDASTDDTGAAVEQFDDERIQYHCLKENRGANVARNIGIKKSNSKYVSFLDSDDEFSHNKLYKVLEKFDTVSKECGAICHSVSIFRDGGLENIVIAKNNIITHEDLKRSNKIGSFSCFTVKKEVFEQVGYLNEKMSASQDYEFYLRLTQEYHVFAIIDVLAKRHLHGNQISTDIPKKSDAFKKLVDLYDLSGHREANQEKTLGLLCAKQEEYKQARVHLQTAFYYGKISTLLLWVPLLIHPRVFSAVLFMLTKIRIIFKLTYYSMLKLRYDYV